MAQQGQQGTGSKLAQYFGYATFAVRNVLQIKGFFEQRSQKAHQKLSEEISAELTEQYAKVGGTAFSNVGGAIQTAANLLARGNDKGETVAARVLEAGEQEAAARNVAATGQTIKAF